MTGEPAADLAFRDVRVFDGEHVVQEATVLVADGRITAIGPDVAVPEDTRDVVDGTGMTLLPGLIDAHTHVHSRQDLEHTLRFGVTTSLDMFMREDLAARMREEQEAGDATDRADLRSAGLLATAPGGHGTQFDVAVPALDGPEDAESWVADRVAAGADYIKVVIEEGYEETGPLPTLDASTVRAIVAAAHASERIVLAHVHSMTAARMAVEAGVDGLAHMFNDVSPDAEFVTLARRAGVFVVPTLPVLEHMGPDAPTEATLAEDPEVGPCLSRTERANVERPYTGFRSVSLRPAMQGIRLLHDAGVPIAAGSDAPNPGTAHGASLHRELELLTRSGLSASEALESATSVPARLFHLDDRGRISMGLRADLVLVNGDPTSEVLRTRALVDVWKDGVRADRSGCGSGA